VSGSRPSKNDLVKGLVIRQPISKFQSLAQINHLSQHIV
jgi:hypothetical protein